MLEDMYQFQQLQKELTHKLQSYGIEHGQFPTQNLTVSIAPFPLLPLLKGQSTQSEVTPQQDAQLLPHIYWQNKEQNKTLASFGAIETLNNIPTASDDALYLGGLAFQQQGEQWPDFPETLFIRPLIVFQTLNQQPHQEATNQVVFHFNGSNSIERTIKAINTLQTPQALAELTKQHFKREDSPTKTQWANLLEMAIEYKALLPKVVLSRETKLSFNETLNTSPERLFSRHQRNVVTEALAGTVNRGRDQREDNLLLQSLLNDKKIDRENYLVQESIIANLKQLKAQVHCDPAYVMQLQHVQHLCVPIQAELTQETEDRDLLYKLHPTPAVGGTPKLPALQFINDNEPYARGWYAGAVGYISKDESDFSVAIRSALISKNSIKLFAGAGIVTGSIAEQEWQELDNKIQTILRILGIQ